MEEVLSAKNVCDVFMDCLFKTGEDTSGHVKAEGIVCDVDFHPARLKANEAKIVSMLEELPSEFQEKEGGGWSFLNARLDKHGHQWVDLHQTMERLFQLGMAIDRVRCLMPRDMWEIMPGGMPYYAVKSAA